MSQPVTPQRHRPSLGGFVGPCGSWDLQRVEGWMVHWNYDIK